MSFLGSGYGLIFTRGSKLFELTNHLGNVLTVISDKKYGQLDSATSLTQYGYYLSDIIKATDYYPFGMISRNTYNCFCGYRYGFNGKENDRDVKGDGNQLDFGARIYDPRISRWLSVDPMTERFPSESPYVMVGNSPLIMTDKGGAFKIPIHKDIIKEALRNRGLSVDWHFQIYSAQDVADLQNATDDVQHFDNCFTSNEVYSRWRIINQRLHDIKIRQADGSDQSKSSLEGLQRDQQLGLVLHAVQDFYSHSNYVELYIQYYHRKYGYDPNVDEIPVYEDGILNKEFKEEYLDKRLHTGGFNVGRWLFGRDRSKTNNDKGINTHHDEINKDNEQTPEGSKKKGRASQQRTLHEYARKVALKATQNIIKQKVEEAEQRGEKVK